MAEQTNHSQRRRKKMSEREKMSHRMLTGKCGKWKRYSNGNGCLCATGVLKYLKKIKSKKKTKPKKNEENKRGYY